MQRVIIFWGCLAFTGCVSTLPPTVSFNSPANFLGMVEANAWLDRVEITDEEVTPLEPRTPIENALTNHLWRFLLDGKYFRRVELLPGTPQPEDLVLKFVFHRSQRKKRSAYRASYEVSDLSASLTLLRSDGTVVREVRGNVEEKSALTSTREIWPGGMKARTQLVEELLQKALWPKNPIPLIKEP